mgnify:CR=1 FL=1
MKKKTVLILLFISLINTAFSQRETDNWYFGVNAGLKFTSNKAKAVIDGAMVSEDGTASLSDVYGNLLLYTNGKTIWNRNHQIMDNGDDLFGEPSNTQTSIIIPKPDRPGNYYVFYTKLKSEGIYSAGLYYSEILIDSNTPLGKVINKNKKLTASSSEKLTAVHHSDGKSFWLFSLNNVESEDATFFIHRITTNGIALPIKQKVNRNLSNRGAMKVSPDGKKLAVANFNLRTVHLFNFDSTTGSLSLKQEINLDRNLFHAFSPLGIEFSQDSNLLYTTNLEYDSPNIYFSITQIDLLSTSPFTNRQEIFKSTTLEPGTMQLATDGKIYVSYYKKNSNAIPNKFIGTINSPEKIGNESSYRQNQVNLLDKSTYRGLPNFVQSYLRTRIATKNECVFTTMNFKLDAYAEITKVAWDFGDGSTSNNLNTNHTYQNPGEYLVTAKITMNGIESLVYKNIIVYALPELLSNKELIQCDINNGKNLYNLTKIETKISTNSNSEIFTYYKNEQDLILDQNPIIDPVNYISTNTTETIYARVINQHGCESSTSFKLKAVQVSLGEIPSSYSCEIYKDGQLKSIGSINLKLKEEQIRGLFNLPRTTKVQFYPTLIDAQTKTNSITGIYNSPSTQIWVRTEDVNLSCSGIEPINLIVNKLPVSQILKTYTICKYPDESNTIILDGKALNDRFEWRNSNGLLLSTNRFFKLLFTGKFTLTVYKTENNIECSNTTSFTVINKNPPEFENTNVTTTGTQHNIHVSILGTSNYAFSLDNTSFSGNSKTFTFNNVFPGIHTIYVKDINNCEPSIEKNVTVLGYPDSFTPNNDGINDRWNIAGGTIEFFKTVEVHIYNRYGKLLYTINKNNRTYGWDGNYNGIKMASNDYWFTAVLIDNNNNIIKKTGHFSLLRK